MTKSVTTNFPRSIPTSFKIYRSLSAWLGMIFLVAVLGCGGGGGGGGGGGSPVAPPISQDVTLTGQVELPAGFNSDWSASIRPALGISGLTAQAFDRYGTSIGMSAVDPETGVFTLILSRSETRILIEISNGKRFKLQKFIESLPIEPKPILVNAASTAEAYLNLSADPTIVMSEAAAASLTAVILAALQNPPSPGQNLAEIVEAETDKIFDYYTDERQKIVDINNLLTGYMKAETLEPALPYISPSFGADGIPTANLDDFKFRTQRRFNNFTIEQYNFNIKKVFFTSATEAIITFDGYIRARTASLSVKTSQLNDYEYTMRVENGGWVMYRNFPYLESQLDL